ncbi:unnamed protein product [Camellia sinensis]
MERNLGSVRGLHFKFLDILSWDFVAWKFFRIIMYMFEVSDCKEFTYVYV